MAKKKLKRRGKMPPNIFQAGGDITSGLGINPNSITTLGKGGASGTLGMQSQDLSRFAPKGGGFDMGSIGGIGAAVTGIAQAGMSNAQIADTSGIEAGIKSQKNMIVGASSNDELMNEWGSWNKSKDNYSWKDIRGGSTGQRIMNTLGAATSGATTGATVGGPIGAVVGGVVGLGSAIGGWFGGNSKAKRKARQLNKQAKEANERALSSFETRAENIDTQNDFNMLANFSAYGGPLEFGSGAIGYEFGNEYLNNQKMSAVAKQRLTSLPNSFQALPEMNTYNAFAEGGPLKPTFEDYYKTIPEYKNDTTSYNLRRAYELAPYSEMKKFAKDPNFHLRSVYENPKSGEYEFMKSKGHPTLNKELEWYYSNEKDATDFRNKYDLDKSSNYYKYIPRNKFDNGGNLYSKIPNSGQHGGDFTNGVTFINEGGSHEENPYQGVQIGVDPKGAPNLVEQGEVVYDDYVFSDRMEIPDDIRKEYKLRGKTFAKAAKSAQRESEERPNDPLSTKGLQAAMERITEAQEEVKNRKRIKNIKSNRFDKGGPINPAPIFTNPYLENSKLPDKIGVFTAYGTTFGNAAPLTKEERDNFEKNRRDYAKYLDREEGDRKRQTWTRYAPIMGSGLASLTDVFSKPDYGSADIVGGVDLGAEAAGYTPIGNYLSYRPLDRDFYINKMNQQAAATRRGLMNTSGGNRLNAQAGILAADYNYGQNMGNLARQAEEYNQQLRERVEAFNRGTNMFNTEAGLKTSMFNAESRSAAKRARLGQATTAAQLRQGIKDQDAARRSANITNFLQGLGDMGWENFNANMINSNPALYYILNSSGEVGYKRNKKKKGGRIVR